MAISYFDAPAGSGKTHVLVEHAHRLAEQGRKILFVQPSCELISRTINEMLEPLRPTFPYRAIHGDTHGGTVVAGIVGHFRDTCRNHGEILFITHAAFLLLPFLERAADWEIIVDELLQVDLFESFNIPDTHRIITDGLTFVPGGGDYGRLYPASRSASAVSLDRIARNPGNDQVLAHFNGIANRIRSQNWEVYAKRESFERLIAGDKGGQLQTYSMLGADIVSRFGDTIIASACFTDSMLYQLWSGRGVALQPVGQEFFDRLRYQQHGNGAHVTIRYVLDEHWSKTKRDMVLPGGGTLGEAIISRVGQAVGDAPFVWMGNKDQSGVFEQLANATQLPNSPHGRNDFQHFHNVVVLSALNAPPTHFAFMDTLGVSNEALKTAHYRSAVYQAVMRTSIRNPHDTTPKTVIVMDRPTAHWLAGCFPGAHVELLNLDIALPQRQRGRPPVGDSASSNADRQRRHRQKMRDASTGAPSSREIATARYGSVFETIFSTESILELELDRADDDGFIALLAEWHQRVVPAKGRNFLIAPATFDPHREGASTQRGKDNITETRGIWLDFDDGDLSHEDLAAVFPALRIAAFNTYSTTASNNRWRAFIPTSRTMSAEEYEAIVRRVERTLVDQGWGNKRTAGRQHGLDASKMDAASLFYAPCQAADQSASFFHDHSDQVRKALGVDRWLEGVRTVSVRTIPTPKPLAAHADREAVTDAIAQWRATPPGSGHRAFFALAARLQRAGLTNEEVEELLLQEAANARSPKERRAEISTLMTTIAKRELEVEAFVGICAQQGPF